MAEGTALAAGVAGVVAVAVERMGEADAVFEGRGFIVAWGGVLALAFADWPPLLLAIKAMLNARADGDVGGSELLTQLAEENHGSRWPKITIAALLPGQQLTLEDLRVLRTLCKQSAEEMARDGLVWNVGELQVAAFTSRSLEQRTDVPIPLRRPQGASLIFVHNHSASIAAPRVDGFVGRGPIASSRDLVEDVLQEWERGDLESYLARVNTGANVLHYMETCPLEHTLVALLTSQGGNGGGDTILRAVQRFAKAVREHVPGKFHFFSDSCPSALHLTLRTLRLRKHSG